MLDIPKDICKKLICSSCKKYLSVLPIKVYPNREVKCGRCCNDKDKGTVSTLYQTLIANIRFPCIYRKEGCSELCLASMMKDHESKCSESRKKYCCPACHEHEYSVDSYNLSLHIDKKHKDIMLEDAQFVLCFGGNDGDLQKDFFYQGDDILLYTSIKYNSKLVRFVLRTVGTDKVGIQICLLSVEHKLLKQTGTVYCSEWNNILDPVLVNLDITDTKFPNNIVLCKFQLLREYVSVLPLVEPVKRSVYDGSISEAVLRYTFKGLRCLQKHQRMYSDVSYYLMNLPWKLFIQRSKRHSEPYLGVFLEFGNEKETSCKVRCGFQLVSNDKECVISRKFAHIFELEPNWGFSDFVPWNDLFDADNGYVANDSMTIEADLSIITLIPKEICQCEPCSTCKIKHDE